jgi:hypothetical protein
VVALHAELRRFLLRVKSARSFRTRIPTAYFYNAALETVITVQRAIDIFAVSDRVRQHAIAAYLLVNDLEHLAFGKLVVSVRVLTKLKLLVVVTRPLVSMHKYRFAGVLTTTTNWVGGW